MCGREIVRQVRPGHQMEREHAHTKVSLYLWERVR